MSLSDHGLIMQTWKNFPTIYALLNNPSRGLDSPLDPYGISRYSDNVVDSSKVALENIGHLIDAYAGTLGNKDALYVSDLMTVTPKIEMELTLLIDSLKYYTDILSKTIPTAEDELKKIKDRLAPREYYRFKSEDVSNLGPFDSAQSIEFKNSFTLVIGDNGSGKTTIVNKLRSHFPDYLMHPSGLYNLSFLIFMTGDELCDRGTHPSELLLTYGIEKEHFGIQVNELLEDLRPNPRCYARLTDKNYPLATGEVIMMNIVMNFALRKILRLDFPIVLDTFGWRLDDEYLELFFNFLRKNCSQAIFFSLPNSSFQQIGLNSDYYLQYDYKTNKSIIIKN